MKKLIPTGLLGVVGLTAIGLLGLQGTGTAQASNDAVFKRDEDAVELVLVDDDDDNDTNSRSRDTRSRNTGASRSTRDNTRSNFTKVSRDRDRSRGDKTRDWTRDGGEQNPRLLGEHDQRPLPQRHPRTAGERRNDTVSRQWGFHEGDADHPGADRGASCSGAARRTRPTSPSTTSPTRPVVVKVVRPDQVDDPSTCAGSSGRSTMLDGGQPPGDRARLPRRAGRRAAARRAGELDGPRLSTLSAATARCQRSSTCRSAIELALGAALPAPARTSCTSTSSPATSSWARRRG